MDKEQREKLRRLLERYSYTTPDKELEAGESLKMAAVSALPELLDALDAAEKERDRLMLEPLPPCEHAGMLMELEVLQQRTTIDEELEALRDAYSSAGQTASESLYLKHRAASALDERDKLAEKLRIAVEALGDIESDIESGPYRVARHCARFALARIKGGEDE